MWEINFSDGIYHGKSAIKTITNTLPNSFECSASLDHVALLLETLTDAARQSGMCEKNVWKLETSVDEALTNIICYGCKGREDGVLRVRWEKDAERFVVTIEDDGVPFDQTQPTHPDFDCEICDRKVGGLGRYIMSQFLDGMRYERIKDRNRLTLIKNMQCNPEEDKTSVASPSPATQ